jgi:hypothetical protein
VEFLPPFFSSLIPKPISGHYRFHPTLGTSNSFVALTLLKVTTPQYTKTKMPLYELFCIAAHNPTSPVSCRLSVGIRLDAVQPGNGMGRRLADLLLRNITRRLSNIHELERGAADWDAGRWLAGGGLEGLPDGLDRSWPQSRQRGGSRRWRQRERQDGGSKE